MANQGAIAKSTLPANESAYSVIVLTSIAATSSCVCSTTATLGSVSIAFIPTTITPTKLGQGSIATTLTTRYTVPAATCTMIKDITICNTSNANTASVSVYLVPVGQSASAANILFSNLPIVPNGLFQWTGDQNIHAGDTIRDIAVASGCTINISGGEAT